MNQQDFVDGFDRATFGVCAPARQTGGEAPATEPRQCEPTKRSPLPSAREIDAAIERKYGSRPYGFRGPR
jgi:hypothetical protein